MIKTNVSATMRKEKINEKSITTMANKATIHPNIVAKIPVTMEPPYTTTSTPKITIPARAIMSPPQI